MEFSSWSPERARSSRAATDGGRRGSHSKDYIRDVQEASASLTRAAQEILTIATDASRDLGATFGAYDADEGVNASAPAAAQKGAAEALSKVEAQLKSYVDEIVAFDKTVQAWTPATPEYQLLGEKDRADALSSAVLGPMARLQAAAGQLASFVSEWHAAYEAASGGGRCTHGSDCARRQLCVGSRCTAVMNKTMKGLIDSIGSAVTACTVQGTLNSSPFQKLATAVNAAYTALFHYVLGV